jgi:hypothetical protein
MEIGIGALVGALFLAFMLGLHMEKLAILLRLLEDEG